jgi:hypothetical protein
MLPTKLRFIWSNGFRGEDFLEIDQSEKGLPMAAMFVNGSGQNVQSLIENLPQMLPAKYQFIWLRGFRGED